MIHFNCVTRPFGCCDRAGGRGEVDCICTCHHVAAPGSHSCGYQMLARELVPAQRQGEHHIAVRFGDHHKDWRVRFDGMDVSAITMEALAGAAPDGWAVILHGPRPHPCAAGDGDGPHLCVVIRGGNVAISRHISPPARESP